MPYAIDFGTSNTVITRLNQVTNEAEVVNLANFSQQSPLNPPLIPSLLYIQQAQEKKVLLGQTIRDQGLDLTSDSRFFQGFKRGIGASIQGFLPQLDETQISFEQVGEWFLTTLIEQLLTTEEKLDSLILTVPVDSFEVYRNWLGQICEPWPIEQFRIVDEPTAAALGYEEIENDIVLVIDFGGGTLDFSLVDLDIANNVQTQGFIIKWGEKLFGQNSAQKQKTARVLGKAGTNLGGSDIDNWLVDYFAQTQDLGKTSLTTRLAERLKIKLSSQNEATEIYFNDQTLDSYELSLDQGQFKIILDDNGFFTQLDDLMTQVLQQGRRNGIEKDNIDKVLLVGGSTQIPAVQNWIKQYFSEEKIKSDRPFTAIAQGALQLAQGMELKDFLYHSYGIRYWDRRKNAHQWHSIIKAGQPYPMSTPVELYLGASLDNQPSIELIIGELGEQSNINEVYFDGDRLITRSLQGGEKTVKPLNDRDGARTIARLNPLGKPGKDRLKLQFFIDESKFLRLTVEDLLTQEALLDQQIVTQLS
ncbi:MAG: Hsp70 family protein [Microcystaceae cyanobacterium]